MHNFLSGVYAPSCYKYLKLQVMWNTSFYKSLTVLKAAVLYVDQTPEKLCRGPESCHD